MCAVYAMFGCGPEREFSGVWRQAPDSRCEPAGSPACGDDDYAYEIHVGRFGDDVAGLLFRFPQSRLDPFDGPEADCYFLTAGRATSSGFSFGLHDTEDGGWNCVEPHFRLEGNDESLDALIECGEDIQPSRVRFVAHRGTPRRTCRPPDGGGGDG